MGKFDAQTDRRDTVRSPLEPSIAIRQIAGRGAERRSGLKEAFDAANSGSRWIDDESIDAPFPDLPSHRPPLWSIAAIVVLLAVLGLVVQQRLSTSDRSWARWERHELADNVRGQSPDVPAKASSSTVPPLWSQSEKPAPKSQADFRLAAAAAPRQSESQTESPTSADPFAVSPPRQSATPSPRQPSNAPMIAPRILFEGDQAPAPAKTAARALPPSVSENSRPLHSQPGLDFTRQSVVPAGMNEVPATLPSPAPLQTAEPLEQAAEKFHRVQHAAGVEQPNSDSGSAAEIAFPEPTPARRLPTLESVPTGERARPEYHFAEPAIAPQSAQQIPSAAPAGHHPHSQQMPIQALSGEQPAPHSAPPLPKLESQTSDLFSAEPEPTLASPSAQQPRNNTSMERTTPLPSLAAEPPTQQQHHHEQHQQHQERKREPTLDDPLFTGGVQPPAARQPVQQERIRQMSPPSQGRAQPAKVAEQELPPDDVYKVGTGDNYWTISRRFYGSARFFSALAEYNKHRIPDPEKMKPGMYVIVPNVEILHQRYPELTGGGPRDPAEDAPPGFFVDADGRPAYRVGKGDTLTDIAQAHLGRSSRWVQIFGMNKDRLRDGKTLKIGTVLRLPTDASQVVLAPAASEIR